MNKQDIMEVINNNILNEVLTDPPVVKFLVHGGVIFTNSIPHPQDYRENYLILRDVTYRFSTSNIEKTNSIVIEYSKIIGASRY